MKKITPSQKRALFGGVNCLQFFAVFSTAAYKDVTLKHRKTSQTYIKILGTTPEILFFKNLMGFKQKNCPFRERNDCKFQRISEKHLLLE